VSLKPTAGARFLLERTAVATDERSASYRASIHTPDRVLEVEAELALEQPPRLTASAYADDALHKQLMAIAKQVSRAANKSRADGLPAWPRRVLRWKGPGRGA